MQQYSRANGFGVWVNVRLAPHGITTANIYKDLFKGFTLKYLSESFLGRDMKKVQSCDDLTDQQKKTRIEWIIAELQDNDILPYNYVYDRDKLVIGEHDEISWFLWNLVKYDIRELWDSSRQFLTENNKLINESYSWIPSSLADSPFRESPCREFSYKETQERLDRRQQSHTPSPKERLSSTQEKAKKLREKKKKMKPEDSIIEMIQLFIEQSPGSKRCPTFSDLEDLSDTRVLLRLINAIYPSTFTPEVLLNDRWTIKLALDLVGEMMDIPHKIDSEDLVHCDVMATCTFFVAVMMIGLKYKQATSVVDRVGVVQEKLVANSKIMEELPNIAQSLDVIRQKKEVVLKLEVLGKELARLEGSHDIERMRLWVKKLDTLQSKVNEEISSKIEDRFEVLEVPRSTTINSLVKFMYINLNLTTGIAFYTSNCKEVISPERKIVLFDKKDNIFIDDFSGADNCSQSVRQLLNIPTCEITELRSDDYGEYVIYYESPSRNKLLKAGAKLLYQVFPGSPTQCERALFKAVKGGEIDTVIKLVKFYKSDYAFVNATYRDTGNSSLHFAVKGGHFKIALFLLESGADPAMQNKILQTPLFLAVESLDRQMTSLLIEWGADIYVKNINNLDCIKLSRNDSLKEFLLIKFELIRNLVRDINSGEGAEALSVAVNNHHHNQRRFASLRSRIYNGMTLLHVASKLGTVPVIELLLEHRLDVDIPDAEGKMALHYAHDLQTAAILLEARSDVTRADHHGNTPLHSLCIGDSVSGDDQTIQLDVGELLLENGCSVLARNKKGYLPVHCCAIQGRADYIKLILGVGGDDLKRELASDTHNVPSLLRLSTEAGHWRCSDWLLKNGFTFKEGEGERILESVLTQRITHANPAETVSFLVNLGTDPCSRNPKSGNQALHYAARNPKFTEVLCLLLELGGDMEGANEEGETPLFYAVKHNNFHGGQILIDAGANINHKNKILLTPFQIVEDYDEWINSGVLSENHKNLLRSLSLQQNQETVRKIMRVVRSEGGSSQTTSRPPTAAYQLAAPAAASRMERRRTLVNAK